jgi:hypothetical protein
MDAMSSDQAGQGPEGNGPEEAERLITQLEQGEGVADFGRINARLDAGIAREKEAMRVLLSRLGISPHGRELI